MGDEVERIRGGARAAEVVADGAEVAGTPGKRALTDRLSAPPKELPEVKARVGTTFEHMHYEWAVLADGAFELRARPPGAGPEAGRIGARVAPAGKGWLALAVRVLTLPPVVDVAAPAVPNSPMAPTSTDVAGGPAWWPTDSPAPEVHPSAPAASWADTLMAPIDTVLARARGLVADAKSLIAAHAPAPTPNPASATGPAPSGPTPGPLPAPRAAAAAAITGGPSTTPAAGPRSPRPAAQGTDLRLARPAMPGQSTLDIASSRLHMGVETTYHLPGSAFSADEKQGGADLGALKSTFAAIDAQVKALNEVIAPKAQAKPKAGARSKPAAASPAPADPARIAEAKASREMLLPAWTLLKQQIDQRVAADTAHTTAELDSLRSGSANASEFWCSGLSFWTLAAAGYNPSAELRGTDGVPFTYSFTGPAGTTTGHVTLKKIIDGEPEAVEAMILIERLGQTTGNPPVKLTWDGKGKEGGHRAGYDDKGKASDAVKGAAYAFTKFGIGNEIDAASQKPGDFAQAHWKTADKANNSKELVHVGRGHAWQVSQVECMGSAMFGATGSPMLKKGPSPTTPSWLDNQAFVIDGHTDPRLVGAHTVTMARRIEANTPDAMGGDARAEDTRADGGVQETRPLALSASFDDKHPDYHVFYGRLNDSPWSAGKWTEATPESARAVIASGAAGAVAAMTTAAPAPGPVPAAAAPATTPVAHPVPAPAPVDAPAPALVTAAPAPAAAAPSSAGPAAASAPVPVDVLGEGEDALAGGGHRGQLMPLR